MENDSFLTLKTRRQYPRLPVSVSPRLRITVSPRLPVSVSPSLLMRKIDPLNLACLATCFIDVDYSCANANLAT